MRRNQMIQKLSRQIATRRLKMERGKLPQGAPGPSGGQVRLPQAPNRRRQRV